MPILMRLSYGYRQEIRQDSSSPAQPPNRLKAPGLAAGGFFMQHLATSAPEQLSRVLATN